MCVPRGWCVETVHRATERDSSQRLTARSDGARAACLLEEAWQEGFSIYAELWADPEFAAVLSHPAMSTLLTPRG